MAAVPRIIIIPYPGDKAVFTAAVMMKTATPDHWTTVVSALKFKPSVQQAVGYPPIKILNNNGSLGGDAAILISAKVSRWVIVTTLIMFCNCKVIDPTYYITIVIHPVLIVKL